MLVIVRLRSLVEEPIGQVYGSHLLGVFFIILPDEVCGELQKPLEDSIFPVLVYVYYFPHEAVYFNRLELKPKKPYRLRQLKSQSYEETLQVKSYKKFSIQRLTACTFNSYGRDCPPLEPNSVSVSSLKRWNTFSQHPSEEELRERFLRDVSLWELMINTELFEVSKDVCLRVFLGKVTFSFHTPEASVFLSHLVGFALYSGNGRKTTMGLGRVFPK
ncbi:MAG: CRISPR system precrRNA processing endoribonuclease RAMP protein Cas6 [Aquificaceae bacterium]|nr:CRISPR system precrRNA processing endoribonuclease RAMP protein Cas6 [Aquificaceae bacterium]